MNLRLKDFSITWYLLLSIAISKRRILVFDTSTFLAVTRVLSLSAENTKEKLYEV